MHLVMGGSRLDDLKKFGQSAWLDCIHHRTRVGSPLAHLIRDGISGIDTNAAGIASAYANGWLAYRDLVAELRAAGAAPYQICERLSIEELRRAADQLRRVYNNTCGRDGYVNIELSPTLAHDAGGTESEAMRLWSKIDRPNTMIKVPATDAGLAAMRRLIAAGLNVNATLIFGAHRYREVAEAYLSGLEDRVAARLPLERVASVASISVSRIDMAVDRDLDLIQQPPQMVRARRLRGRAGVAVAQFVYQRYKSVIASPRWRLLATYHAQTQRLLWASADINNAFYSDLKYVNELIGRDTVTAMSLNTLGAYLEHGTAAPTLERNLLEVLVLFGELEALRIDLDRVSAELEREMLGAVTGRVNTAMTLLDSVA
jgi:transaldolase